MFPIGTAFVAHDNNEVLTVKLGHETSLVAYSTDKRSSSLYTVMIKIYLGGGGGVGEGELGVLGGGSL